MKIKVSFKTEVFNEPNKYEHIWHAVNRLTGEEYYNSRKLEWVQSVNFYYQRNIGKKKKK